jgi:thiol-disulfide isomerase/thioredoxin
MRDQPRETVKLMSRRTFCAAVLAVAVLSGGAQIRAARAEAGRVTAIDEHQVTKIVAEARGNVVVVNFWATWCVSCVKEFPEFLHVRKVFAPQGLVLLFVSIDEMSVLDQAVKPFLRKMQVDFDTYIKGTPNDGAFIDAVSREWSGALPATFIYTKQGVLAHTLIAEQSFDDLATHIIPLLKE